MHIKNIVMFQAITIDGSSQMSFDESKFEISHDDKFVFIKSKKTGQVRGTTFANVQHFIPEMPTAQEILKNVQKSRTGSSKSKVDINTLEVPSIQC